MLNENEQQREVAHGVALMNGWIRYMQQNNIVPLIVIGMGASDKALVVLSNNLPNNLAVKLLSEVSKSIDGVTPELKPITVGVNPKNN